MEAEDLNKMNEKLLAKNMRRFFSAVVATTVVFGLLHWQYKDNIYAPVDEDDTENISFTVKKGTSAKEIGKTLEEKGLISSSFHFYLYTKFNSLSENLIAGRFLLNKSMSAEEIITIMSDPSQAEFIITIQEGLRARDIDAKLVELELIEEGAFLKEVKKFDGWEYYNFLDKGTLSTLDLPIEGYLYPDTYFLRLGLRLVPEGVL